MAAVKKLRQLWNPDFLRFTLGNSLYALKAWQGCIPFYEQCVRRNFRLSTAGQRLLSAYKQLGKQEEGVKALQRALQQTDIDANFALGMAFRSVKDWERAALYFKKALEQHPDDTLVKERLIRTLYDGRYVDELIQLLQDDSSVSSLTEDNLLFLHKYCEKNGWFEQADALLSFSPKLTGPKGESLFLYGRKLFKEDRLDEALQVMTAAKEEGNEKAEDYRLLIREREHVLHFDELYRKSDLTALEQLIKTWEVDKPLILEAVLKEWCRRSAGKTFKSPKDRLCLHYAEKRIGDADEFYKLNAVTFAVKGDEQGLRAYVESRLAQTADAASVYLMTARALQEHEYYQLALKYAHKAHELEPDNPTIARVVSNLYRVLGVLSKSLEYLELEAKSRGMTEALATKKRILEAEYRFSQKRIRPFNTVERDPSYRGDPHRVLHLHHNSVPVDGRGYAMRGNYIIRNLREAGIDAIIVTRPGYPFDLGRPGTLAARERQGLNDSFEQPVLVKDENVDIPVYRLAPHLKWKGTPVDEYIDGYAEVLERAVRELKPGLLHPASNFFNGVAAAYVAKKFDLPLIYEVRGLWEITRGSLTEGYAGSERYEYMKFLETTAMEQADHVVTISEELKKVILGRGIPEDKVTVIPNGVDCAAFTPQACNEALKARLNLRGKTVIGFIGTLTAYEGLELLMSALKRLLTERDDVRLLIVGDGPISQDLQAFAFDEQLEEKVIFTGRVPHEEVKDYYSIIDIFPFPRRNWKVCHVVTPLKPYEVMAMQKAIIVSDVNALKEMVIDGETGLHVRAEDVDDLTDKLFKLIDDSTYREQLARNAREWVLENRDWRKQAYQYVDLYRKFML